MKIKEVHWIFCDVMRKGFEMRRYLDLNGVRIVASSFKCLRASSFVVDGWRRARCVCPRCPGTVRTLRSDRVTVVVSGDIKIWLAVIVAVSDKAVVNHFTILARSGIGAGAIVTRGTGEERVD